MTAPARFDTTAGRYRRLSLGLALTALLALTLADIDWVNSSPWFELGRIGWGMLTPDFFGVESLASAVANTLAFALLGVAVANVTGFIFALLFRWRLVQLFCALIRAVHELFWALLFLQLFGLGTLTGLLAIAIPYTGIFARVYAEILEEADQRPAELVPVGSGWLSTFAYARIPPAFAHLKNYALYRLECGIRSSAVLGFIGLPTLGFHLETSFSQGLYSQAAALLYLFFALIASIRLWVRPWLIPLYLAMALYWLPFDGYWSVATLQQFLGYDIVPAPLRDAGVQALAEPRLWWPWLQNLLLQQALPGIVNTLVLSIIAMVACGILTLLLFPLVSTLFMPRQGRSTGHLLLVVLRSIPELILAFIILLVTGPSMLPAIIALALHNGAIIAHLIGRYSDALLLRDDASRGINRYLFEVLPRIYPQFLAFLLYRWEVIMRETAILGILGIHTLGFFIDSAFEELRFDRALLLILMTALVNMALDQLARALRRRLQLDANPQQARY
ncbi:PhnE/PtxC family ABC transporter permease [Motiliproteus sediminis]|uniref:PhnE/PtxC family ABC transporter permease n=1 Tax=Motiliproteus sediminis TaxID=1468178 RepID=UPI001AF01313|nr:ABC transporter permease [Motiliproteus sediminis]